MLTDQWMQENMSAPESLYSQTTIHGTAERNPTKLEKLLQDLSEQVSKGKDSDRAARGEILFNVAEGWDGAWLVEWDYKWSVVSSEYVRSRDWRATDGQIWLTWYVGGGNTRRTQFRVADSPVDLLIGGHGDRTYFRASKKRMLKGTITWLSSKYLVFLLGEF
jgi:hypothetical protein